MQASNATQTATSTSDLKSTNTRIAAIAGIIGFSTLILALVFLAMAVQNQAWQYYLLAGVYSITAILGLIGMSKAPQGADGVRQLGWLSGFLAISCILTSAFLESVALPVAIIYLVYSLIVTATIASAVRGTLSIISGLAMATLVALVGTFFQVYQIPTPQANVIIPVLLGIVVMIYITLLAIQFVSSPLQVRLTTSFLAVVIIPLAISSVIQSQVASNRLRAETFNSLLSTADEVSIVLDNFISNNVSIIEVEAKNPAFGKFLSIPNYDPDKQQPTNEIRAALRLLETRESAERKFLSSYALLNANGKNVFDTVDRNIGSEEGSQEYFKFPFEKGEPYYSNVMFDPQGNGYIYFSAPVKDESRKIVGVLRSRYSALVLQRLATSYSRLITFNSHAIIFDENLVRLADDYKPYLVFTPVVGFSPEKTAELQAAQRLPNLTGREFIPNPDFARVLTTSRRSDTAYTELEPNEEQINQLPEMLAISTTRLQPWKIVYLKANFDQQQLDQQLARTSTLVAAIMSLLVGLVAIGASRVLSGPIIDLTQTARDISAGNLDARAAHTGSDEYGTLGAAFNLMTERLRRFIVELEERVAQRTFELERRNKALTYRSTQLQTVAEVARSIVTSQELETLLESVTELISDRFGYYHVGVFLLDENREFAVLRAANSEGGKRMLNRRHALKVGKVGIVGFVTGSGQPRIATDVGEDAVFFNNPDLPLTRSEMALPLKIGEEIIGALDVQSTESNAFSNEDIALFNTLADQVAIAIYNNRLYADTARALAETQALHRQYLRQEWQAETTMRHNRAYRYTPQSLAPSEPVPLAEEEEAYQAGEPVVFNETLPDGETRVSLEVPILLRGELIGAIRLQDQSPDRAWSNDETQAVRDVAQQVGVALENARLFERTMLRAERERKVLEITSRIRSTNDPQEMLEIAAAEVQRALGATRAQIIFRQETSEKGYRQPPNGGKKD